ncbi:MAG TPA: VWA domain-containing protein [Alphaproteobacteria bacterium]|jgi:Ca-activated chloride channel family protein|nr:VWA domain-containing protein [Alphaproteobacteria bacterium]
MIGEFHFLRPAWLLALIAAAVLAIVVSHREDMRTRWQRAIAPHLLERLLVGRGRRHRLQPLHLTVALIVLGALAAAGPAWRHERAPFVEDTAPLAVAIDLSRTMDAIDVTPTRLERAKLKLRDLVALRPGGRTALLAYAGSAHMVLPLTDDADLIRTYADSLQTRIMPTAGKDTEKALVAAEAVLRDEAVPGTILLLTDGINPAAFDALKHRQSRNQLLILAIGTAQGGAIKSDAGDFDRADPAATRLDLGALERLRRDAGIELATVTTDDQDVRWAARRIATHLEQARSAEGGRWQDEGWWLVIPIAALGALWFRRGWTIRWASYAAIGLIAAGPAQADAFRDAFLTPDQQGALAFRTQDYANAARLFADPMWRGVSLYRAGNYDDAADIFARLDTAEGNYDQGDAEAFLGKLPQAAASYREALKQRPDWLAAKANLALVEKILADKKKDEEQEADEPQDDPDQVKFDDKGKKGKRGTIDVRRQTAEIWMRNIQTTPTDLLARRFALEASRQ